MKIAGTFNFFGKVFRSGSQHPPKKITEHLSARFPQAQSVEWNRHGSLYEAVFFDNDTEMIARFDCDGTLTELRINVAPARIPQFLLDNIAPEFETMNCIEVHVNQSMYYELIIRDNEFRRFLIMADKAGTILEKTAL